MRHDRLWTAILGLCLVLGLGSDRGMSQEIDPTPTVEPPPAAKAAPMRVAPAPAPMPSASPPAEYRWGPAAGKAAAPAPVATAVPVTPGPLPPGPPAQASTSTSSKPVAPPPPTEEDDPFSLEPPPVPSKAAKLATQPMPGTSEPTTLARPTGSSREEPLPVLTTDDGALPMPPVAAPTPPIEPASPGRNRETPSATPASHAEEPVQPPAPVVPSPMPSAPQTNPAESRKATADYPVFQPDASGRRPIADSARPVNRSADGTPIAPPETPAPRVVPPMPAPPPSQSSVSAIPAPMPAGRPAPAPPQPQPLPLVPAPPGSNETPGGNAPPPTPPSPGPNVPVPGPSFPTPGPTAPAPPPAVDAARPVTPGGLLLEKVGPTTINRGTPLVYEIVVRNITTAPLFNVRVEDEVPPGVQMMKAEPRPETQRGRLNWNLGALDPGGERRMRVELMPSTIGQLNSCATATFQTTSCLRTAVTQPHLALKKTGPDAVLVGETATFQIDLTNDGNGPAFGVILYDELPDGLEHPQGNRVESEVGTLGPGESKHVTLETRATKPGRLVNRACATAQGGLCVTAEAVVTVTSAALTIRKTGPRARYIGREAEFDLEVLNPGSAIANNVQVLDKVPQGLDFVSASEGGVYDPTARSVTWNLGTLSPGQRRGLQVKLVGKTEGNFVNQAFARGDRGLEARTEAPIHIEGVAALMLEVVDLDDPVEVGNESTFEVHVINQGTSACTNLRIVATAPEGMVPRSFTGPASARIQGQQVIFEPLPSLAEHADATYRVKVLCRVPGDWRFRVHMMSDQLEKPVLEEESMRIYKDQ